MIEVNSSLCIGCEQCVLVCPAVIMELNSENIASCLNDKVCINCAHCFAVCPEGAISINGINPQGFPKVEKFNFDQIGGEQFFKTRRSIRVFKKDLVPYALIVQALSDASYAPSSGNSQKVEWILIEKSSIRKQLIKEVAEFVNSLNVPMYDKYAKMYNMGKDPFLRGARQLILAHTPIDSKWGPQDATAAISYLELSLHSRNIGTCWSGFVKMASEHGKIPSINLPEDRIIQGGLMFGYADVEYARIPIRKDIRIVLK